MAVAIVDTVSAGAAGSGVTTGNIDTTGSNLLVAFTMNTTSVDPTPTDSKSNTWWRVGQQDQATNTMRMGLWLSIPSSVGSGHNFTHTAVSGRCSISVYALSGAYAWFGANTSTSATSLGTGDNTLPQAAGLILTGLGTAATISNLAVADSFTIDETVTFLAANHYGLSTASKLSTSSTETPDWSWTTSSSATALRVVIADNVAGGGASAYVFVG